MKAIPVPVRERILKLYDQGQSTREIAASFGYCVAAVRRVRQHFQTLGTLEPQTHRCGRKTLLTESRKARLLGLLARQPDATLAELGARFERPTSTMDRWLRRLGWSCKKTLPAARLVFVDESGAHTQMTRRYGAVRSASAWSVPCRRGIIRQPRRSPLCG